MPRIDEHPILRVFVSSTWEDLKPERKAVEVVLNRLEGTSFVGMEYFGAREESALAESLKDVEKCDIYIGILGPRYGTGIVEAEYKAAIAHELPCFWYVMEGDSRNGYAIEDADKRNALIASFSGRHVKDTFSSPADLAMKVATSLHNWLLESNLSNKGHQYLIGRYINGVRNLPTNFAGRIESFLNEYLATPSQPVPFGGREHEINQLNSWLDDPGQSPYLMLSAPAGRGKSALLVQWSQHIQKRDDIEVAFVPVSIRFRTNLSGVFFAALAARLARLHGETIRDTATMTVEMWRGQITEYLTTPLPNGKKLLVILDSADEAADWEPGPDLFPNTRPKT